MHLQAVPSKSSQLPVRGPRTALSATTAEPIYSEAAKTRLHSASLTMEAADLEALRRIQARHAQVRSPCGALLAELSDRRASLADRTIAARLHGLWPCRRGLSTLARVADTLINELETEFGSDRFPCGAKRYFMSTILSAISSIDTQASHSVLIKHLRSLTNPDLRADVLEAMALEWQTFEFELMREFLSDESPEPILLSALYALRFPHSEPLPPSLFPHVIPLLQHRSASVRAYAVQVVVYFPDALPLLMKVESDVDNEVRTVAAEAIRNLRTDDE